MITFASSTAARVGQLVRLLGSDKDGEVTAAAFALKRTLANAGHDLHQLADLVVERAGRPIEQPEKCDAPDLGLVIRFCARRLDAMGDRDREFIRGLDRQMRQRGGRFSPSPKQEAWLFGVYERLRGRDD